jgi:hypothetical protein
MKKLKCKRIVNKNWDLFLEFLIERLKENKKISENQMLDGLIIGMICNYEKLTKEFFFSYDIDDIGSLFDKTISNIKQIGIWLFRNDETINELFKEYKKVNKSVKSNSENSEEYKFV